MSPCTDSWVKATYGRIASYGGAWFRNNDPYISEAPFSQEQCGPACESFGHYPSIKNRLAAKQNNKRPTMQGREVSPLGCLHLAHPDSKVCGANMGPTWGRQDPGESYVGPMNFAIWPVL